MTSVQSSARFTRNVHNAALRRLKRSLVKPNPIDNTEALRRARKGVSAHGFIVNRNLSFGKARPDPPHTLYSERDVLLTSGHTIGRRLDRNERHLEVSRRR